MGRGQGKVSKKKAASRHLKKTQRFPSDPDADGYEVRLMRSFPVCLSTVIVSFVIVSCISQLTLIIISPTRLMLVI